MRQQVKFNNSQLPEASSHKRTIQVCNNIEIVAQIIQPQSNNGKFANTKNY